jgi:transposase InsO family protein
VAGRHHQQRTGEGWLYLAVVLDAFSRRIVGWSMAAHLRTELVLDALDMAIAQRQPAAGLVHHSGHGCQSTSLAFGRRLRHAGLVAWMGSVGDALDNAVAERCFATSKASCSTATTGRPAKPCGPPWSTSSRASPTANAATQRSTTTRPPTLSSSTPQQHPPPSQRVHESDSAGEFT